MFQHCGACTLQMCHIELRRTGITTSELDWQCYNLGYILVNRTVYQY